MSVSCIVYTGPMQRTAVLHGAQVELRESGVTVAHGRVKRPTDAQAVARMWSHGDSLDDVLASWRAEGFGAPVERVVRFVETA